MTPHPHAEVLRAIADGVPLSEFEIEYLGNGFGELKSHLLCDALLDPDEWQIRRKPQHIMVNGFKVPKPLGEFQNKDVYSPELMNTSYVAVWGHPDNKKIAVTRGIAHTTKEAAIAHAKAMLGIDPGYFK